MKEISRYTGNSYHLVYDFDADDEVRRREYSDRYYFSLYKGRIYELDMELNYNLKVFPESIFNLKGLKRLHLFLFDLKEVKFNT